MGKTERIHKKTVLIIIGILLLLGISCVNSCSTAKQQNAKTECTLQKGRKTRRRKIPSAVEMLWRKRRR